jgi:hypothetical protein
MLNSPVVFIVKVHCSNDNIEYGFIFKFTEDEIINVTTLLESNILRPNCESINI